MVTSHDPRGSEDEEGGHRHSVLEVPGPNNGNNIETNENASRTETVTAYSCVTRY